MSTKYRINPLTMNLDMISDGESGAVKQKLNPLTGNFDMVGEGEVKMKLNPLTSNFDMVSGGGGGGWQPGPNTIAYCPLEQNGADVTGNYELSIDVSSDISFSDNGYGLNVLNKSDVSNYEHANCSERAGTIGIWAKLSDAPVDDDNGTIISQGQHYGILYDNGRGGGTGVAVRLEDGNTEAWSSHYNTNLTDWHLYMFTCDGTDTKFYVDGQLFGTINNFTPIQIIELNLLGIDSHFERGVRGQFSKALWEKIARTAQEITDYYNQTKSLYEGGGWQPGANTIAYRPLTEDLDDVTGNYNLSAIGNYYSFTTNQQGKACCELNPQDSNDTYFSTGQSPSSVFDFANNDYTFVCSLCDASSTVYGMRSGASIFSLGPQFKGPNVSTYESIGSSTGGREFADSISHTGPDVAYDFTQSDFKTIISVWNHTTQKFSYYVDGVLNAEDEKTGSFMVFDNFYLCVDQYNMSDAARRYHGKIRDIIIENKARTAQEISDYCSQN